MSIEEQNVVTSATCDKCGNECLGRGSLEDGYVRMRALVESDGCTLVGHHFVLCWNCFDKHIAPIIKELPFRKLGG